MNEGKQILEDCPYTACDGKQLQAQLATADERIKKMSKGDLGPESILSGFSVLVQSLEKRRDELRDGLTTANKEIERLREALGLWLEASRFTFEEEIELTEQVLKGVKP